MLGWLLLSAAGAVGFGDAALGEFYAISDVDDPAVRGAARAVVDFGRATGFVVTSDGLVLTNHHVYESFGEEGTVAVGFDGTRRPRLVHVALVRTDPRIDVALYRVTDTAGLPWIPLRDGVGVGEEVAVIGHPSSEPLRASFGTVLAKDLTIAGRPSVEYSAQTWWGSSGSAVVDRQGRAVAVHWGWDADGVSNGRLTGVPVSRVLKSFPELGCAYETRSDLMAARVAENAAGRSLDLVRLALDASPGCLARVERVTWRLHPTFSRPEVAGDADRADHPVVLKTWGSFPTVAEVELDTGAVIEVAGYVTWTRS